MPDDKSKKGEPDRSKINVHEDYELRYWTEKLGVTKDDLKQAVHEVGPEVLDVRRHLGK